MFLSELTKDHLAESALNPARHSAAFRTGETQLGVGKTSLKHGEGRLAGLAHQVLSMGSLQENVPGYLWEMLVYLWKI